jgi:S-DNA-T family DNA segregation ATPase FtsK/SpoIIIE
MVDPKRVELTLYNEIPHLLTPVITDAKKAILSLKWATKEMDRRYDILEKHRVQNIQSYHTTILEPALKKAEGDEDAETPESMPYIVIIIDELADLMHAYPRELESNIVRLAQMSRAVGIHLILSTQRPSVNVVTGLIKANIPTRVALQVASQIDSKTILDMQGAEKLLGAGDMLYLSSDKSQPVRIQSAFISEEEVKSVVDWLKDHYANELNDRAAIDFTGKSDENDVSAVVGAGGFDSFGNEEEDDELYEAAKQTVIEAGKGSTSYIQRKLRVGYARAARLMDILEERGVIGPADGSKPRDVLVGGAGQEDDGDSGDNAESGEEEEKREE